MRLFILVLSAASLIGCSQKPKQFQETGILVLDNARNCTSFDYFIPCKINDSLSLGMNVERVKTNIARRIDPKGFQYHMTNVSWISSPDSFYIKDMHKRWFYISAVELTLTKSKDYLDENGIESIDSMRVAGNIYISKYYQGIYDIKHIKQIILSQY